MVYSVRVTQQLMFDMSAKGLLLKPCYLVLQIENYYKATPIVSSQSGNGLVSVDHLNTSVLVVYALPLVVVVVHVIDVTMDNWLPHVHHPE